MNNDASTALQKIFVSYSRKDGQDYAFRLAADLRRAGANIWMDQMDIEPGKTWDLEVENALKSAECVLFIATEKSVSSSNVLNEVYYALDENKRILPAVFHDCPFPFQLRRLQRIDFTNDYDAAFQRLSKALGLANTGASVASEPLKPAMKTDTPKEEAFAAMRTEPVRREQEKSAGDRPVSNTEVESTRLTKSKETFVDNKTEGSKKPGKVLWLSVGVLALAAVLFFALRGWNRVEVKAANTGVTAVDTLNKTNDSVKQAANAAPALKIPSDSNKNVAVPEKKKAPEQTDNKPAIDNEKLFADYKQKGFDLYDANDLPGAVDNLEKALAIKADAQACFRLGRSYAQLKQYPKAIEKFSDAINLTPDKPTFYMFRGIAYRNNGQYAESLADLEKALSFSPNDGQLLYNRGLSKQASGDVTGACTDFQSAAAQGFAQGQVSYNANCGGKLNPGTKVYRIDKLKAQNVRRTPASDTRY